MFTKVSYIWYANIAQKSPHVEVTDSCPLPSQICEAYGQLSIALRTFGSYYEDVKFTPSQGTPGAFGSGELKCRK